MGFQLNERECGNLEVSTRREWVLTNGIGGFSMGTASGINTRRYHGLLVAATRPPSTRMVLLAAIDAFVQSDGNPVGISNNQYPGAVFPEGYHYLRSFGFGAKSAVWNYRTGSVSVEKRVHLHGGVNACTITYTNRGDAAVSLTLQPLVSHKFYHGNFYENPEYPQEISFPKDCTVVENDGVSLFLSHEGADRTPTEGWYYRFEHQRETERGLPPRDDLYSPCELRYDLRPGESAVLVAATEPDVKPIEIESESTSPPLKLSKALAEAASHFFVKSKDRSSIIAGYPWFTDWGRDTMISIPGLCLHTGRVKEARQILLDYAGQTYQGLLPNRFVEDGDRPDYNTVDATLWFANAIYKTLIYEWDKAFASKCLAVLDDVYDWHVKGTLFGIRVDPEDGLLTQGEPGVQLTWMDAKVGDWVVTPRHGKPVEINGLWINALRVMEWLAESLGEPADKYRAASERAEAVFESKFWCEARGHYLDTADPDDASLRPNQVIAMALPFAPAKGEKAARALQVVSQHLLTPVGLRTLGPDEPGYRGRYEGPMPDLDAAYHQGTAWPWLLGSYATAIVKLTGDKQEARRVLKKAKEMLSESGLGGISEVYDGDGPQNPGGCPWQAWSVAEILRAWVEDAEGT